MIILYITILQIYRPILSYIITILVLGGKSVNNEIIIPSVTNTSIKIYDSQQTSKKATSCDWHFHNEIELFYLYEGSKIFYTKNQVVKLQEGDIAFVNSRVPHKTLTPALSRGILIQFTDDLYFDEEFVDNYALAFLKNKEVDLCIFPAGTCVNIQLCECFKKISKEYLNKDKFHNMYIKAYVFEALACLYRYNILVAPDKLMNKKSIFDILPALDYISKHYCERITLDDVCSLIYTEKSHFCKLFKKATKTSFLNYLNFIRICHAEILLRQTRKSIAEIAIETGFSSPSYFAETFKKINLLSPTAYRKMNFSDSL